MGTRFNIAITAQDQATARIRAIKAAIGQVTRPITDVGRSVKSLGKEVGIDRLATGLHSASKEAAGVARSLGGIGGALGGAIGIAGMAAYAREWALAQAATARFAMTSGLAVNRLQRMEGGARAAGLEASDLDGAVQGLGNALQDARWGRNQGALMMMNRLGLRMKFTRQGAIDTEATLGDLADILGPGGKLSRAPVQTKQLVADQFGVGAMLPVLLQGRKAWEDYQRAAAKVKPPLTREQQRIAADLAKNINLASLSFEGLGNAIVTDLAPNMTWLSRWVTDHNVQLEKNIRLYGLWGSISRGTWKSTKDFVKGIGWAETKGIEGIGHGAEWLVKKGIGNVKDLGNLISAGEGGYNSVSTGKRGGYKAARTNLIESSIESVMAAQKAGDFSAAGKYQIMPATLREAVKSMHLDTSKKFDQATQERIFKDYLIRMKRPEIGDYISGKSNDRHAAQMAASKEWASLADPDTGKSHYDGVANNKASISADRVADALDAARQRGRDVAAAAPGPSSKGHDDGGLGSIWKGAGKPAPSETTVHLKVSGLPQGTKAEVTDSKGPVKTVLKVESSMPDYTL